MASSLRKVRTVSRSVCNASRASSSKSSENKRLTLSSCGASRAQLPDTVVVFGAKAFHGLVPGLMRRSDLFEASQGCFVSFQARQSLFFFCDMIVHNSQPANQRRKRESLQNEGCENDTEGEQEDEVAPGEWLAVGERKTELRARRQANPRRASRSMRSKRCVARERGFSGGAFRLNSRGK